MKTRPIVMLIALAALFFAMILPPEAYANGKLAVTLCATFAFLIALSERRIPQTFVTIGGIVFGLLLAHTFLLSVDLYRSLDTLSSLWAYYCLIGFFAYSTAGQEKYLAGTMVALSIIVAGYGLYQYFWGFDQIYQYIFYSASDQVLRVPALQRIAERRVSSTLALPGTLWGFLVCAIPFHGLLWNRGRLLNGVLLLSLGLLLTAGFLTRSFGFLLGLFVLAVTTMLLKHSRLIWNRVTPLIIVLVVAAGLFYSARRSAIEGQNPAGLRFKNWVSAWNMFGENPLGTGLNTFGVLYPVYMQPEANETQFVHNTLLQLLAELGYPLVIAIAVVIVVTADRLRLKERLDRVKSSHRYWLLLALAVWIAHNLVDINVYFGSLGVLGAVTIGAILAREQVEFRRICNVSIGLVSTFAIAVITFSVIACISSELQIRAQIEFGNKKLTTAVETLALAQRVNPINSSLYHDQGEILLNLYHQSHQQHFLTEGTAAFRKAVVLSPKKSGSHIGYSLCLSTANRIPEAIEQIRIAQQLYPSSAYVQSISQLLDQRIQ
jgi:hypothetical protein